MGHESVLAGVGEGLEGVRNLRIWNNFEPGAGILRNVVEICHSGAGFEEGLRRESVWACVPVGEALEGLGVGMWDSFVVGEVCQGLGLRQTMGHGYPPHQKSIWLFPRV